jgi:Helix-turn-helix domain
VNGSLQPGAPFNPYRMFRGLFIPEGLARYTWISPGAKLAWGRLARYAGEDGRCYPTMKTLGAEIGVGERQAQKYRAELERAKLIRRVSRCAGRARTSNAFEFLWHDLFDTTATDRSGKRVNDDSPVGANDSSPEESQIEESHSEERKTDLDYLPLNRKNRDSPSGDCAPSICKTYPNVRECLARYMQVPGDEKEYPTDRIVVDLLDAAGTYDEQEVIASLNYLYRERGLRPFTSNGPRSFAWFKTVLQEHFTKKREGESAANPSGYHEWEERNETAE